VLGYRPAIKASDVWDVHGKGVTGYPRKMNGESNRRRSVRCARQTPFKAVGIMVFVCLACNTLICGQTNPKSPTGNEQLGAQQPLLSAQAIRVDRIPRLDGTLNDPLWQQASPVSGFLQRALGRA
jgi:hypothetical protein